MLVWWCFCVGVVMFLWCSCGGVFVVVFLWCCKMCAGFRSPPPQVFIFMEFCEAAMDQREW